jgi:hypothetical protein
VEVGSCRKRSELVVLKMRAPRKIGTAIMVCDNGHEGHVWAGKCEYEGFWLNVMDEEVL